MLSNCTHTCEGIFSQTSHDLMQAALNSTPSVSSCGLYGPQDSKLWALSQIESLHLWEWAAAADEEVPGEQRAPPQCLILQCQAAPDELRTKG